MDAERIERYAGLVDRFRTFQDGDRSRERWDVVGSMLALEQDMTIDENLEAIDAALSRGMTEDQIKDAAEMTETLRPFASIEPIGLIETAIRPQEAASGYHEQSRCNIDVAAHH